MGKWQWVRLLHPRSGRKATGGFEKKIKKFVQGRNWNGYYQFFSAGSRPSFEVVTGRHQVRKAGPAARAAMPTTALVRTHGLGNARATWARQGEVTTSFWHRDLDLRSWCRDILFGVAT